MRITHKMLVSRGACVAERNKFRELFPDGVTVTRELCIKHAQDFEWNWAVRELLGVAADAVYNLKECVANTIRSKALVRAAAVYRSTIASAQINLRLVEAHASSIYDAAERTEKAFAVYFATTRTAQDTCFAAIERAETVRGEVEAAAYDVYCKAKASAFADACGCP
jgi:hypothetical protein